MNFWTQLEKSNVTQWTLTLLVWGGLVTMVIMGRTPPDWMTYAGISILAYFFGLKQNRGQLDSIRNLIQSTVEKQSPGKDG